MGKDGERGREGRDGGEMNFITKLIPQTYVLSHEANNGAIHSRGLTLIIQPSFQGSSSGVHWGYKPPPTSSQQGGTSHAHLDIKAQAFPAVWSPWVLTTFHPFIIKLTESSSPGHTDPHVLSFEDLTWTL